jgi:GxxExxY protein
MATRIQRTAKQLNDTTSAIIRAAIGIHRTIGPGLFENVYCVCLAHDLRTAGLKVERERPIHLTYKNVVVSGAYKADLDVDDCVLVEVKAVDAVAPIHLCQVATYIRLANYRVGLLLNFGAPVMKDGIHRVVNNFPQSESPQRARSSTS